jgi:hypothetical protein
MNGGRTTGDVRVCPITTDIALEPNVGFRGTAEVRVGADQVTGKPRRAKANRGATVGVQSTVSFSPLHFVLISPGPNEPSGSSVSGVHLFTFATSLILFISPPQARDVMWVCPYRYGKPLAARVPVLFQNGIVEPIARRS